MTLDRIRWFENAITLAHNPETRIGVFNYILDQQDVEYSNVATEEFNSTYFPKANLYGWHVVRGRIFRWGDYKYSLLIMTRDFPKEYSPIEKENGLKNLVHKTSVASGIPKFDFIVDEEGYSINV